MKDDVDQDRRAMIHDPIRHSQTDAPTFNQAWLKSGESLSCLQRVGFTALSFAMFSCGLFFAVTAMSSLLHEEEVLYVVAEICGILAASAFFVIPGILGLRNVLRFPVSNHNTHRDESD